MRYQAALRPGEFRQFTPGELGVSNRRRPVSVALAPFRQGSMMEAMKPRSSVSSSRRAGPGRVLGALGFWAGSFLGLYAVGLGLFGLTGLAAPLVPIAS